MSYLCLFFTLIGLLILDILVFYFNLEVLEISSKSARIILTIIISALIILAGLIGFRIIDGTILNLLQYVSFPLTMVIIAFSILDINNRNDGINDFEKNVKKALNYSAFSIIFLALVIFIWLYTEDRIELDQSIVIVITVLSFAIYLVTIFSKIPCQGNKDNLTKHKQSSLYNKYKGKFVLIWTLILISSIIISGFYVLSELFDPYRMVIVIIISQTFFILFPF